MELHIEIREAYETASSYPDLVKKLIEIGVESYTVDVATSTTLYRFPEGNNILHTSDITPRGIMDIFDEDKIMLAIHNTLKGKNDYSTFIDEIAKAGVRFYEATLIGTNRRVTYIGGGSFYEEEIVL